MPEDLGLEPGEQAQGLGVALEPADVVGQLVQRGLAVVAEGRVAQVVGQAGGVDDVRVAAQGRPSSRPTWATSSEWVSRVRTKSSEDGATTWVLAPSRRSAEECSTRARSRSNAVR